MLSDEKFAELLQTVQTLHPLREVIEARILKTKKGTVSGYFDDFEALVNSIANYIGQYDIYMTLNPVNPSLLARSQNRLQHYAKQSSSDGDVEKLQWILVDFDPVRPSGISATKEEKHYAGELMKRVRKELLEAGFPEPIICNSGNGYHLLISVDLENTPENVTLVKRFLDALDFLYSNEHVQVDRTTYNPARIVKFYGTLACKGDDIEERPHRWSKLVKVPEERIPVTREALESIVSRCPKVEKITKEKSKGKAGDFNLETFISEHGLDVAYKAPYQKGTKYILQTCPWNSDHTNQSAFIIHFDNGAIAAGCHHNSCKDENWKTLRALLEPESVSTDAHADEESQSDIILRLAKDCQYLKDQIEEFYAAARIGGHSEVMALKSERFKLFLTKLYYEETGGAPNSDAMRQALKVLEAKASFSENEYKLQRRIALQDEAIYYDLCDKDWNAIKVTKEGSELAENPPILFTRNKGMREQVQPDLTASAAELPSLVQKHFRFKRAEDSLLFTVYLVSSFLPQIAHVILVLFGEKGAAKSTTMRMVKRIVDPGMQDLLSMPTSKQDLAIILSNTYMPCFDNLDTLSAEKSDMLCMAATGGSFSKRTLFTDSEETILRLKRCVALNGINVVATRADLLDRSIVLELERIPKEERKTEKAVWDAFEADLPKFLGAIFNTLSQALKTYETVELDQVGRMADFTFWGYAIAEVLKLGGQAFLKAYLSNQDCANEEALASHPVAAAVQSLLKTTSKWSGSVSNLLRELERVAENDRINMRVRTWPKDANVLSKRLKEVKSNLEEVGIFYDIRHAGAFKKITLEKKGDETAPETSSTRPDTYPLNLPTEEVDDDFDNIV